MRPIIFQETPDELVEITFRCQQSRLLFRPGEEFNRRFLGCVARAEQVSAGKVRTLFAGGTSNHCHLLILSATPDDRAAFKCHLRTNLSKEVGDLHDWKEGVFGRRCRDIPVHEDRLEARLMYLAAQGVKENLVATPRCWPGVNWVLHVTEGRELKGVWYNRTEYYREWQKWQRRKGDKGPKPRLLDHATWYRLELPPIPGFDEGLPEAERRAKWRDLVERAVKEFSPHRPVLGPEALLNAHPHEKPVQTKRSPAPWIHTGDQAVRRAWMEKYRLAAVGYGPIVRAIMSGRLPIEGFPTECVRPTWLRAKENSS